MIIKVNRQQLDSQGLIPNLTYKFEFVPLSINNDDVYIYIEGFDLSLILIPYEISNKQNICGNRIVDDELFDEKKIKSPKINSTGIFLSYTIHTNKYTLFLEK